jgi:sugar lactone lactonase YvrE
VLVTGTDLPVPADAPPRVFVGSETAHVLSASPDRLRIVVPPGAAGGTTPLRIEDVAGETAYFEVGRLVAGDVNVVDSPVFGADGRLILTFSGDRTTKPEVPLWRLSPDGDREAVRVEVGNPTSVALGPDGALYVSSRFDGCVYRLNARDDVETFVSEVGVPTGLAFAPDGRLFVGDRSGSIFSVTSDRRVEPFATLPASVAAFHLAFGPDDCLYVAAPTLSTHDVIYRITPERLIDAVADGLGRPQGLAFDAAGTLFVVDALAGSAGLYRVDVSGAGRRPELVVAAPALVGVAFDPGGGLILASNDRVWRFDNDWKPYRHAA